MINYATAMGQIKNKVTGNLVSQCAVLSGHFVNQKSAVTITLIKK